MLPVPSFKRGLATHHPEVSDDAVILGARWRYNWLYDIPVAAGIESVPMIYSPYVVTLLETEELGGNSRYLLGFNEPDRPDQANVTPMEAVVPWQQIEAMFPDRLLVSPAPSHESPEWLAEFRQEYIAQTGHPPRWQALAIHCYFVNDASGCQRVINQVMRYARDWDVPGGVWVTEFGPAISMPGFDITIAKVEAHSFIAWMEMMPEVIRYAWFPTRLDGSEYWYPDLDDWAMLVDDSGLTDWGRLYIH